MLFKATGLDEITKRVNVERERVKSTPGDLPGVLQSPPGVLPSFKGLGKWGRINYKGVQEGAASKVGGKSVMSGVLEAK